MEQIVKFHPSDRDLRPPLGLNPENGYNGSSTVEKAIWIGSFPLTEKLNRVDSGNGKRISGNFSLTLYAFNGVSPVQIILLWERVTKTMGGGSSQLGQIASHTLRPNQSVSGDFSFLMSYSYATLENGSDAIIESYEYLTQIDTTAITYGMFKIMMVSNDNWSYSAEVAVRIESVHNPSFFELMKKRHWQLFETSEISSSTIFSNSTEIAETPLSWSKMIIAIMLLIFQKKIIKNRKSCPSSPFSSHSH